MLGRTPRVDGLTRPQTQVLAAVAAHPFGFRSMRAVSRATTLSPTAAGRAVRALVEQGLVDMTTETVAEGSAREVEIWRLHIGQRWLRVAATVAQVVLPVRSPRVDPPAPPGIPRRFWHLFWDVDPGRLTIADDGEFIATRLVLGPNLIARSWALSHLSSALLEHAATNRSADPSMRALIHNAVAA